MRLTERHTRHAAGDEARVDGVDAVEEAGEPGLRTGGGARVEVLRGAGEDVLGAVGPQLDVLVVNGAAVGGSGGGMCSVRGSDRSGSSSSINGNLLLLDGLDWGLLLDGGLSSVVDRFGHGVLEVSDTTLMKDEGEAEVR